MLGMWLILFLLMIISVIAVVLFFVIIVFLIILTGSFAGVVSGAISNNGLKGAKIFLFVTCTMTGFIFGGLSYLLVSSIVIGNTPESLLPLLYYMLPGSIAGGAEQLFGKKASKGYEALFSKLTTASAILFMILSVVLVLVK